MAERRTLTRADLADAAHQCGGVDQHDARELVDEMFRQIADELVERSGKFMISGFGSFVVVRSLPRIGRNPKRPKEEHLIPARSRVAFRASLELRARVKERGRDA